MPSCPTRVMAFERHLGQAIRDSESYRKLRFRFVEGMWRVTGAKHGGRWVQPTSEAKLECRGSTRSLRTRDRLHRLRPRSTSAGQGRRTLLSPGFALCGRRCICAGRRGERSRIRNPYRGPSCEVAVLRFARSDHLSSLMATLLLIKTLGILEGFRKSLGINVELLPSPLPRNGRPKLGVSPQG